MAKKKPPTPAYDQAMATYGESHDKDLSQAKRDRAFQDTKVDMRAFQGRGIDQERYNLDQALAEREAAAAGGIGSLARGEEQTEMGMLKQAMADRMAGAGPSVAAVQQQQGLDAATRAQLQAGAGGGQNSALAGALAGGQMAPALGQVLGGAAQGRAAEVGAAQGQLGQVLHQEQQQLDQMTQFYVANGLDLESSRRAAEQELQQMRMASSLAQKGINTQGMISDIGNRAQIAAQKPDTEAALIGGMGAMGASFLGGQYGPGGGDYGGGNNPSGYQFPKL